MTFRFLVATNTFLNPQLFKNLGIYAHFVVTLPKIIQNKIQVVRRYYSKSKQKEEKKLKRGSPVCLIKNFYTLKRSTEHSLRYHGVEP